MSIFSNLYINIFNKKKKETVEAVEAEVPVFKYKRLYDAIGFYPKTSEENYIKALTHASYTKKQEDKNERLEFLGDAVLNFLVAEFLFEYFHKKNEGELTKLRSKLVNRQTLNELGHKLHLHKYVRHKLSAKFQNTSPDIIGNALEALIGAYYLDYGINDTKQIISKLLLENIDFQSFESEIKDYKSFLYEWAQAEKKQITLRHKNQGVSRANIFVVNIYIDKQLIAEGAGKSKKEAEKDACYNAYKLLLVEIDTA